LYDLIVNVLFVVVWDGEKLLAMGIFISFEIGDVLLVNSEESNGLEHHVGFSQIVELADELTYGTIAVFDLRHDK
jgi:hypothetical protein